jgi:hypothetical protein
MPVILATQEAEIRRIMVQSQHGLIVQENLSRKNPSQKRAGGVTQGIGPEFKPQYYKKKKNKYSTWTNCNMEKNQVLFGNGNKQSLIPLHPKVSKIVLIFSC